jgi:hypothetical protein
LQGVFLKYQSSDELQNLVPLTDKIRSTTIEIPLDLLDKTVVNPNICHLHPTQINPAIR